MTRISRHTMFMEIAHVVSKRSTCCRLNVGAVVTSEDNRIVSIGYNGTPPGATHCLGDSCPGRLECRETIHAETNALNYVPARVRPHSLYVTNSPCPDCWHYILSTDLERVIFEIPYRKTEHLSGAVSLYQLTPAGYLLNWYTQRLVDLP